VGRLSWRRSAEIAVLAVGAAWVVTTVVVEGLWLGIGAVDGDSGIGYAVLALLVGVPVSLAVLLLGGALIVRAVAARRGVVLPLGRSMLLQAVVGLAGGAVAAGVTFASSDSDLVVFAVDLVATLLLAVPMVRWLAKPMAVAAQPDW